MTGEGLASTDTDSPEGPVPREDTDLLGQTILGAWIPVAVASTGTACEVFRADAIDGDSRVLLHVIRPPDTMSATDLHEALESRRRVRHPGLLQLLMSGRLDDGRVVLVTPSTGASTLASHLAMRPPRLPTALHISAQIARGLQAVHDTHGGYGPLTPEHVLIVPDESGQQMAQLLPVWWAWRHGFDDEPAAPWLPAPRATSSTSMADDVWSLGALIWHAIAGSPPTDVGALDTLDGTPKSLPALSSQVRRRLPASLDLMVSRLTHASPDARPRDLAGVADELEDLAHSLDGGPSIGPPMVMNTPVPVGGQLRERSLVLPVAPPARTISKPEETVDDYPTAPSGTRALRGVHMPVPRTGPGVSTDKPKREPELRPPPRNPDDPITADPMPAVVGPEDMLEPPSQSGQEGSPAPKRPAPAPSTPAPLEHPQESGQSPWMTVLAVIGGLGLVSAAIILALYLAGIL